MTPTKRQIAKALRKASRLTPKQPLTTALFEVCKPHGARASLYYDNAIMALKSFVPLSFRVIKNLPTQILQRKMRGAARALEHGLPL